MSHRLHQSVIIGLSAVLLAPTPTLAAAIQFSAAGADAASIQDTVSAFQAALGEPNNGNTIGPLVGGRRQVDWDGNRRAAPPFNMPADFFNAVVPRGNVYATPGSGFQISGADGDPLNTSEIEEFGNINPTYPDIFRFFSAEKLFTTIDSNILDVNFFVPGTNIAATVTGFGAVFTDVDLADTTKIEYFGVDGSLIFSDFVAAVPDSDESLSFLGVLFDEGELISRVRITSGNAPLSANNFDGGDVDIVALDDFIYSEPQAAVGVPEPTSVLGLLVGSILPLLGWKKQRRCQTLE